MFLCHLSILKSSIFLFLHVVVRSRKLDGTFDRIPVDHWESFICIVDAPLRISSPIVTKASSRVSISSQSRLRFRLRSGRSLTRASSNCSNPVQSPTILDDVILAVTTGSLFLTRLRYFHLAGSWCPVSAYFSMCSGMLAIKHALIHLVHFVISSLMDAALLNTLHKQKR